MRKQKRGRELFKRYKTIINIISYIFGLFGKRINSKFLVASRYIKGKLGIVLRYIFLKNVVKDIGDNVSIFENVYLLNPEKLSLGNNISIHPMCYIDALGSISIGDDVSIAHSVSILSFEHDFTVIDTPIKDQKLTLEKVTIENNVWIGAKATILYKVNVGEGSIIAANSVVNKNVDSFTIVAGIPAKVINLRR